MGVSYGFSMAFGDALGALLTGAGTRIGTLLITGLATGVASTLGWCAAGSFDEFADSCVDETKVTVVVSQIHTLSHLHLLGATITHRPILCSVGHYKSPSTICRPSDRVLRGGSAFSSHLMSSSHTRVNRVNYPCADG